MDEDIIQLKNITKTYKTGDEHTVALNHINLNIQKGEFLTIMGPSGSGKSTMMHILGLLDTPTSGEYILEDSDVSKLKGNQLAKIRNQKIGFVFQQFNLLPRTNVLNNVLLPTIYGNLKNPIAKAKEVIKNVGLNERIKSKGNQLSGGQIQRVAIARALVMEPSILLADEPTGNLDSKTSIEIMDLFKKINKSGTTIILITHEPNIADCAERIIELKDGKIIKERKK
jgi:putative ABC transport system ATP-binding protein